MNKRNQVKSLLEKGLSVKEICHRTGISRGYVYIVRKNSTMTGQEANETTRQEAKQEKELTLWQKFINWLKSL